MGENHIMLSYISKITFIGSTNFQILQHQLEGGTNPLIYRHQPEGSYNSLNSPATTGRRLQPPIYRLQPEGSSNSLSSLDTNQKEATTPFPCPILSP
jgi:hypothetical protein